MYTGNFDAGAEAARGVGYHDGRGAFVLSFIILKLIDWIDRSACDEEDEDTGLDLSQHGEAAYSA